MNNNQPHSTPLFADGEWTEEKITAITEAIEEIAQDELELDYYPFKLEIISSEQMMDAYASSGMPINYHHWSYGKQFAIMREAYKRGQMSLAYEIVINSNPCLAYLMEENTMTMQALVIAHAAFGHNAFMKNNYLFKEWTHADAIIDYLAFARNYVAQCEEKYDPAEVEQVLDACHALQRYGVFRSRPLKPLSLKEEEQKQKQRAQEAEKNRDFLWDAFFAQKESKEVGLEKIDPYPKEPQENILYFIEKNAPNLPDWKREIIRIVRKRAQYFYPQIQTKVLNEGFATFTHHYIMNRLWNKGLITEGAMQEFLHSHTNVIYQPDFGSINPYALGFAMFTDVQRICQNPTEEDKQWFPDIAGSPWLKTVKSMAYDYNDSGAILQFLSPSLIRHFHFFGVEDKAKKDYVTVMAIHDEAGYKDVRSHLSAQKAYDFFVPRIEVDRVNRDDRNLILRYHVVNGRQLDGVQAKAVLNYAQKLWRFPVILENWNSKEDKITGVFTSE